MPKHQTTPAKRFKILYLLVQGQGSDKLNKLLEELKNLSLQIDANHPKAMEALCYFEDNVLAILTEGLTVEELN